MTVQVPAIGAASNAPTSLTAATGASPAAGGTAPGEADPAQAKEFDGHMASAVAPAGNVQMHRVHATTHSVDSTMAHIRTETAALDAKYESAMEKGTHISSIVDPSDPMMTMVQLADFSYSTSMTLAQYQFSMSMANASNGLTHSLLKNQSE